LPRMGLTGQKGDALIGKKKWAKKGGGGNQKGKTEMVSCGNEKKKDPYFPKDKGGKSRLGKGSEQKKKKENNFEGSLTPGNRRG